MHVQSDYQALLTRMREDAAVDLHFPRAGKVFCKWTFDQQIFVGRGDSELEALEAAVEDKQQFDERRNHIIAAGS